MFTVGLIEWSSEKIIVNPKMFENYDAVIPKKKILDIYLANLNDVMTFIVQHYVSL